MEIRDVKFRSRLGPCGAGRVTYWRESGAVHMLPVSHVQGAVCTYFRASLFVYKGITREIMAAAKLGFLVDNSRRFWASFDNGILSSDSTDNNVFQCHSLGSMA